jgi:glucose dehydrogenase
MKKTLCGKSPLILLLAAAAVNNSSASAQQAASADWTVWGGDPGVSRFSTLDQINTKNVSRLKPAWIYDSGKFGRSWEDTPLLINGLLYVIDAGSSDVVALEPETGKQVWRHEAPKGEERDQRALAYWGGDGNMKPRLIMTWGSSIYGIDPSSGKSVSDWPQQGFNIILPRVQGVVQGDNLGVGPIPDPGGAASAGLAAGNGSGARPNGGGEGVGGGEADKAAPVIYKNLIIIASASGFLPSPGRPADVRAYDLRTGKLAWQNRLVPDPGQPGAESWADPDQVLGSSSWGFLSLDEATGTVYVLTDSGSPDLVGVWRPGDNKWADSTVALDAMTGKIKWGFQNNRHDLWDMDTMAAPVPVTITKGGKKLKAIVQSTKQGQVWILNADTGQPVFGWTNKPVVQSKVPGERTSPTQPFPDGLSLAKMSIDRDHLSNLSTHSNADCKKVWDEKKLHNEGPYTPPSPTGWTAMVPGAIGGIDWGGVSIDPDLGYAITNVTNMPTMVQLSSNSRRATPGNNGWAFTSGYVRFHDADGRPCISGRQGEMIAINLNIGKVAWRVPFGDLIDEYGPRAKGLGATNIGPSIVTRGGVVFIGAATDGKFHAFDAKTGRLAWQAKMSASSNAGPLTYMGKDGRQYVVIAAGGPGNAKRTTPSDPYAFHQTLVAFALPRPGEKPIDIFTPYPKRLAQPGDTNMGPPQ